MSTRETQPKRRGSAFGVVMRFDGDRYKAFHTPDSVRGMRPEDIWLFGEPGTPREFELRDSMIPIISQLPGDKIHRVGGCGVDEAAILRRWRIPQWVLDLFYVADLVMWPLLAIALAYSAEDMSSVLTPILICFVNLKLTDIAGELRARRESKDK